MARENANRDAQLSYKVRSGFFVPPDRFAGCFTTFYRAVLEVEDGGLVTDYFQPEWGTIRFFSGHLPSGSIGRFEVSDVRCAVTGPSSRPLKFLAGTSRTWGIGFLPLGWARFVRAEAADLANMVADGEQHPAFAHLTGLCEVLCDPSASDEEQFSAIVETMDAAMEPTRDDEKIRQVHHVLMDEDLSSVTDFAERSGMSARTLERVTRRYFGFTPKLLIRRQRFMRSLVRFMLHPDKKWTDAMDGLYHDQAQFSREFRQFMTMSPSEYARIDHPILDSLVEARTRIWGSPAQTLDKPD
ncbi:helix-turn-helix domain-containing protein [Altererythrobacter sp. GH1-8]|uniref:helix-turn-helix domain-containing protein n=1 Tax=Altererythrobacter sp. GH1-8 TaxID=3349333 RepID=UPI00374D2968